MKNKLSKLRCYLFGCKWERTTNPPYIKTTPMYMPNQIYLRTLVEKQSIIEYECKRCGRLELIEGDRLYEHLEDN